MKSGGRIRLYIRKRMETHMKKTIVLALALILLLGFAACGSKNENTGTDVPQNAPASQGQPAQQNTPAPTVAPTAAPATPAPQKSDGVVKAVDGGLDISKADLAIVVNGKSVPMPYHYGDLIAAGLPEHEDYADLKLNSGDFFTLNIYLDENEDYVVAPAYYNGSDSAVSINEAEAEEISITCWAEEPVDQNVSIFGVKFGMKRSEVHELLGDAAWEDDSGFQYPISVTDAELDGYLTININSSGDDGVVDMVDLSVYAR